ncbi:MAG TPA: MBOAT family protein [Polyangiaceae bacterium]|nr:MBOAT family protein [Polyangiaceae bacterium]
MPFSSVAFLFAFLPTFLLAYYLVPDRYRNAVALLGSLCFYAWGAPRFLPALIAVSAIDFLFSRQIARAERGSRHRTLLLALAISLNLALLLYFKYANFVVHEGNRLAALFGEGPASWQDVALPMGISFVVFEEISYLVDVFRGSASPARRFSDYALFLSLFPHSIAGPIFRWQDLEQQLRARRHSLNMAFEGALRFSFGLAKKVLVANHVAPVADLVFGLDSQIVPTSYAWVGLLAYTLQIYFDFSGYSDMAIGLGKMMGFSFKENFEAPYTSASISEFWRRWHISLSTWLRDYLYIPLGGSRVGESKRYRNLIVVFLVCGAWHGANWTFLAWGAYHGTWLVIEQSRVWNRISARLPRVVAIAITFLLVMLGWVLFRCEHLSSAAAYYGRLLWWHPMNGSQPPYSWGELLQNRTIFYGTLGIAGSLLVAWPRAESFVAWLVGKRPRTEESGIADALRFAVALSAFLLAVISLVNSKFNPFIYFRF